MARLTFAVGDNSDKCGCRQKNEDGIDLLNLFAREWPKISPLVKFLAAAYAIVHDCPFTLDCIGRIHIHYFAIVLWIKIFVAEVAHGI